MTYEPMIFGGDFETNRHVWKYIVNYRKYFGGDGFVRAELRHYESGHVIYSEKGFSWTSLFFGPFVPLFRGDLKWFLVMVITDILIASLTMGIGLIIPWIAFACIYNGNYIKDLGKKGYIEVPYNREERLEKIQHNLKQ